MTGPQEQAILDAYAETIERGRAACTPYRRRTGQDMPVYFLGYVAVLVGAFLFIALGGIS